MGKEDEEAFWVRVDAELLAQEEENERVRLYLADIATLEEREQMEWDALHGVI